MGKTFCSLQVAGDNDNMENDSKRNDNDRMEFIIEYKKSTIKNSVFYQHMTPFIYDCDEFYIKKYPHCKILFKSICDELYVLTHVLFEQRIVCEESTDNVHKIMDYQSNTLRVGQINVDYTIVERNGIAYYSHPEYDTEYLKLLNTDPLSVFSFEFGMSLQQICTQVLREYEINISTSIKANKLPFWKQMAQRIIINVCDTLKEKQRENMIPYIFSQVLGNEHSGKYRVSSKISDVKNIINTCINQCDFESFDDNNVMILLNYTNSVAGKIHVNDICKLLPNCAIKLLAMYKRALALEGWSKEDIDTCYKSISQNKDLSYFQSKYDIIDKCTTKSRLCKHWWDGDSCIYSKPYCYYAHGLKELQVVYKFIFEAIRYAMGVDFSCQYKSKKWCKKKEEEDIKICNLYKNKIKNIDKYVTEQELRKCKKILRAALDINSFKINKIVLSIIFNEYLGCPDNCTPDMYYLYGERPIINGEEISFIDNIIYQKNVIVKDVEAMVYGDIGN